MHKVTPEVSIGVTKGEIYTAYWMFGKGMLGCCRSSKLMLAVISSTGHDLMISCKGW